MVEFISKYHWGLWVGAILVLFAVTLVYADAAKENESYSGFVSILAAITFILIVPAIISFMHRASIRDESVMLREVKRPPMARLPKKRW